MGLKEQLGEIRLIVYPVLTLLIISIAKGELFWDIGLGYYIIVIFSPILVIFVNAINLPQILRKLFFIYFKNPKREILFKNNYFDLIAYDIPSNSLKIDEDIFNDKTLSNIFQKTDLIKFSMIITLLLLINLGVNLNIKDYIILFITLAFFLLIIIILLIYNFLITKKIEKDTKIQVLKNEKNLEILIEKIRNGKQKESLNFFFNLTR